jgi:hypothetical protein
MRGVCPTALLRRGLSSLRGRALGPFHPPRLAETAPTRRVLSGLRSLLLDPLLPPFAPKARPLLPPFALPLFSEDGIDQPSEL